MNQQIGNTPIVTGRIHINATGLEPRYSGHLDIRDADLPLRKAGEAAPSPSTANR